VTYLTFENVKAKKNMSSATMINETHTQNEPVGNSPRFTLWIDGVGAYLLCLGDRITFGGPQGSGISADLPLLANLSRRHATVVRSGEGYLLEAHSGVRVADRTVHEQTNLNDGYEIQLGENVRLRFRLPSALSTTANIDFESDHRPSQSVDGVILMDETCLLGPGRENHVWCPDWSESVLLFRQGGGIWCKSRADICVDGQPAREGRKLNAGSVVTGVDLRFRIEPVL
jgi:hypothetical protein